MSPPPPGNWFLFFFQTKVSWRTLFIICLPRLISRCLLSMQLTAPQVCVLGGLLYS